MRAEVTAPAPEIPPDVREELDHVRKEFLAEKMKGDSITEWAEKKLQQAWEQTLLHCLGLKRNSWKGTLSMDYYNGRESVFDSYMSDMKSAAGPKFFAVITKELEKLEPTKAMIASIKKLYKDSYNQALQEEARERGRVAAIADIEGMLAIAEEDLAMTDEERDLLKLIKTTRDPELKTTLQERLNGLRNVPTRIRSVK